MTDTPPPVSPEPTPPATGYTAQPAANPYRSAGAPAKSPVLSIISLIAGILGLVGTWIVVLPIVGSILGLFLPAAAVILGFLGKRKEPAARGMWLTGIILGFVALAIAIIALVIWIIVFATASATGSLNYRY